MKTELIRCQECGQIQNATIQHGEIFDTYIHNCECGYTIMESEWDSNISVFRASLIGKWFDMTKAGIKTEDYRELNEYWCRRLLELDDETEWNIWQELIEDLANPKRKHEDAYQCLSFFGARLKKFDINIMTWGYPKSTDTGRILKLEHKGIEIRTGNPEWGAEPGKLYFVIKHGKEIKCQ